MKFFKQFHSKSQFYSRINTLFIFTFVYFSALSSFAINNFSEIAEFQEIEGLLAARAYHQCVFVNNFLYCIGGRDNTYKETTNVWCAEIQNDKKLGKWKASKNSLNIPVIGHQCFRENNYIYCIGGKEPENNSVWYSEIYEDNSIGEWKKSSHSLDKSLSFHQCFTTNGYIYCAGGRYDSSSYLNIWYTKSTYNGEIEEWNPTTDLPTKAHAHQCIPVNDYIYFIAGHNGSSFLNNVWYTKSQTDGSLETWKSTEEIPKTLAHHQCFTTNENLYCAGGYIGNNVSIKDIWLAIWDSNGGIQTWIPTRNTLEQELNGHQVLAIDSFIYSCGGNPYTNKAYLSFVLPYLKTHPDKDKWYITDKLELQLAFEFEYEPGYYYLIDNSPTTTVEITNSTHSKKSLLTETSELAVKGGTHYLHFALADSSSEPQQTYHFKFNNFLPPESPVKVSSSTHPNQNEWYTLNNCRINIDNKKNGINIHYDVYKHPDTTPYFSKTLKEAVDSFVIPGMSPGIHNVHIRAHDSIGTLAAENLTTHFRINIKDQNQTTPTSLPIVKELNIDPLKVSKDGKLQINATISTE